MKRIVAILTIASAIFCISLLILLPVSELLSLPDFADDGEAIDPNASFAIGSFHCAVSDRRIWLFNDDLPYTGSIMTLEGTWGGKSTTDRTDWDLAINGCGIAQVSYIDDKGQAAGKARYGDLPGIYYRYFEWWNQQRPLWTLRFSLWYPIIVFAVWPSCWIVRKLRHRGITSPHT